jgi:hypothetical protein
MKRISIAATAALCLCTTAWSGEPLWIAAGASDTSMIYFDGMSLKRRPDGTVSTWLKMTVTGKEWAYSVRHATLDCKDPEQISVTSAAFYATDGRVLETNDKPTKSTIYPGSVLELAVEGICNAASKK